MKRLAFENESPPAPSTGERDQWHHRVQDRIDEINNDLEMLDVDEATAARAELLDLVIEVQGKRDAVRGQIDEARRNFAAGNAPADPAWLRRAEGAHRGMARMVQDIQHTLGLLRRHIAAVTRGSVAESGITTPVDAADIKQVRRAWIGMGFALGLLVRVEGSAELALNLKGGDPEVEP